jgi:hypothetical protein
MTGDVDANSVSGNQQGKKNQTKSEKQAWNAKRYVKINPVTQ